MIFRQQKEVNMYLSDTFKRTIYKPSLLIFQEEKVVEVCCMSVWKCSAH